jgi:very-short-patch-repair endonuclease
MATDSSQIADPRVREDLKNLLRFTEELLATRDKIVFDIQEYPIRLTEWDLLDTDQRPLPGISLAPSEDTWLSFQRLQERAPPPAPASLAPWLSPEAHPTPFRPPALSRERVVQVSAETASDIVEAGFADADRVMPAPTKAREAEQWDVVLRPHELPEVVDALSDYVEGAWHTWAQSEAPRRQAMKLYEGLFKAQAQLAASGGEGSLELVVGIGVARWQCRDRRINVPVIEQRAEFALDESDGTLSILPRDVPPLAVLSPFFELGIPGAAALQREIAARLERSAKDPDVAFNPFQPASFLPVLETCAARLDASGVVLPQGEPLGPAGQSLRISPSFCVIVRPRRDDVLRDDLRRFAEILSNDESALPETARRFVLAPADVPDTDVEPIDLAALESTSTGQGFNPSSEGARESPEARGDWLFFPGPANEEQEEIARRLEEPDVHGVVVQGPPGTGKTHTIANIIGHTMAMGRRVLVSAHTAEALTAIRDKLPPTLRDLTIAVTYTDREGARQLEEAVSALAERVQSLNPRETKGRAEDLLRSIRDADRRVAEIDAQLATLARANLAELPWRGRTARPQAIAAWVAAQGDRHAWFQDALDFGAEFEPRFDEAHITEARALRCRLGQDLCYRAEAIPIGAAALPGLGAVLSAHRALREASVRSKQERDGELPRPDFSAAAPGEPAELLAWLERLAAWRDNCTEFPWMIAVWDVLAFGRVTHQPGSAMLRPLLEEAASLAGRGEHLALQALVLPEVVQARNLSTALQNLAAGRKAFGPFSGFRGNPVRQAIDAARVAGVPPRDRAHWSSLMELHAWRGEVRGFAARWNAFATQYDGPAPLPDDHFAARLELIQLGKRASDMLTLAAEAGARLERIRALFPYGLDVEATVLRIDVTLAIAALRANQANAQAAIAERLRTELRALADAVRGAFGDALRQVAEVLGDPDVSDAEIDANWREVLAEADRLAGLREDLKRVAQVAGLVAASGAPRWAERIEHEPAAEVDAVLPADWRDAWDHARAKGLLSRVANRATAQGLADARAELIATRERAFLEVVGLLTYLRLRSRLTADIQAALRGFLTALARLPKTTGAKTAVRQRRILRQSLQRAVKAIPCWIMPEWRVAEQLPPELGAFDLVIIDEASQSNIMALPVVLRGKKLLIVGDDRQVSPVSVGIEEAAVNRLRITYLEGQPLADHIDPATSLYELAGMMYPGKVIVLREHFRCVEPIIRFSSRFYASGLVPLRVPKPSERLDPPLIDIFVEDGARRGDVNEAEAAVIVDEIKRTILDPAANASGKRSIGVISLHAYKQAKLINDRLIEVLGPQIVGAHRIMCGDAATFQGQERDIVFLSMVHDANTATRQSSRLYEQRYNVALSRARDRMVLVRSVSPAMLTEGDIKLEVLRHFQDPTSGGHIGQSDDVLVLCESQFEREVGRRLLSAGYRLRAQVPAGGYRIDFVVEGGGDRRLAVELDGDAFHGPERWAYDVRRQKSLERVGWTFWRCWASQWEADKEATFRDLLAVLERLEIEPTGAAAGGESPLVEFRRVRHGARPDLEIRESNERGVRVTGPTIAAEPATPGSSNIKAGASSGPPAAAGAMSSEPAVVTRLAVTDKRVRVGDVVLVRYADGSARQMTVQIVADQSADGRGRIAHTSPLAKAILGLRPEDEAELTIDGRRRTVVVEEILLST